MDRRNLWIILILLIILQLIIPYYFIAISTREGIQVGAIGATWETGGGLLQQGMDRDSILPPLLFALMLLTPGIYYTYLVTNGKEDETYVNLMMIISVVVWVAILFFVPLSLWLYEGIPFYPIANYWVTLPNFLTLSLLLLVVIPSLLRNAPEIPDSILDEDNSKISRLINNAIRRPEVILGLILLFIPDLISIQSYSGPSWRTTTRYEFASLGWVLGIESVRTVGRTVTTVVFTVAPAAAFPSMIVRWVMSVLLAHEVLAFLNGIISKQRALLSCAITFLGLVYLSSVFATPYLLGTFLRYPVPFPVLQLVSFYYIQTINGSARASDQLGKRKARVKVPIYYMLRSMVREKLGRSKGGRITNG
ncbi:MAG: hypothetical protein RTU30_08340 [Candidatus Thorarchaeota archaeon]